MSSPTAEKRDGDESSDNDEVRWQPYTTQIYILSVPVPEDLTILMLSCLDV